MSGLTLSQSQGHVGYLPDCGASFQSSSSSNSASSWPHNQMNTGQNLLSPLFSDLVTLITARKCAFEYYTVIILTDGQFTDNPKFITVLRFSFFILTINIKCILCFQLLKELSLLPVSLIFVGIGLGDFRLLLELEQAWVLPFNSMYLNRKFVHLIHFRCKNHWDSSLAYEKYRTNPSDVFTKEILTTVQEHALDYFKRCFAGKK